MKEAHTYTLEEIGLPFQFIGEKQKDAEALMSYLDKTVESGDYFEIGPPSAKLLHEILSTLCENWGG